MPFWLDLQPANTRELRALQEGMIANIYNALFLVIYSIIVCFESTHLLQMNPIIWYTTNIHEVGYVLDIQ